MPNWPVQTTLSPVIGGGPSTNLRTVALSDPKPSPYPVYAMPVLSITIDGIAAEPPEKPLLPTTDQLVPLYFFIVNAPSKFFSSVKTIHGLPAVSVVISAE